MASQAASGAAAAIDNFYISNEDVGARVPKVDMDGGSVENADAERMAANEATSSVRIK